MDLLGPLHFYVIEYLLHSRVIASAKEANKISDNTSGESRLLGACVCHKHHYILITRVLSKPIQAKWYNE